jgi:hypothetical protein
LVAVALASAQGIPDPVFAAVPFDRWRTEGDHAQIPWEVRVAPPVLGFGQHVYVGVSGDINGKELAQRPTQGELIFLLQFTDSQGRTYQHHGALALKDVTKAARNSALTFSDGALVTPGDYRIAVAILDTATGEHSFAERSSHVERLAGDPLPDAWRDLPAVEMLPPEDMPEAWLHPTIHGRLHLPLETRRPVHVEVLLALPGTGLPNRVYTVMMSILVPELNVLSQVDVRNGSLDVALLDLNHLRVGFEQSQVRELDWPKLRTALINADPNFIAAQSLQNQDQDGKFFASQFNQRIQAAEPLRVVILLGLPTAFHQKIAIPKIDPGDPLKMRVFYIRYPLAAQPTPAVLLVPATVPRVKVSDVPGAYQPDPDQLADAIISQQSRRTPREADDAVTHMLKPVHPRVFKVRTAEQFRKALAAILEDISRM